ncbi:ThiF family adenylyltransferase [bacterium]|nr:ThiF family adenylyltransferase [bacterium]
MSFSNRTEIVVGKEGIKQLADAKVALFGLGGVGAAAALDLVRVGIGTITVVDFALVTESNLNRLAIAFDFSLGKDKIEVFTTLAKGINPDVTINTISSFLHGESMEEIDYSGFDFVIDAIDSLNPKINLIVALLATKTSFISVMGTGGRIDPTRLKITDFWDTTVCSLARSVRKRLRNRNIHNPFPVVWSDELPIAPIEAEGSHDDTHTGRIRKQQGSTPFVPQTAGHFAASFVVRKIVEELRS